jgi:cell division protease FtsH
MADALMKWETIDKNQIDDLMAGKEPRPPLDESDTTGRTNLQKSDKGDDKTVNINKNKPVGQV